MMWQTISGVSVGTVIRWYWSTRVIRSPLCHGISFVSWDLVIRFLLSGIGCHWRLYWAGLSYTKLVSAIHGFVAVLARLRSWLCTGLGSALQRRGYTYIPLVHSLWSLVISRVFRQTVAIISIFVVPSSFSPYVPYIPSVSTVRTCCRCIAPLSGSEILLQKLLNLRFIAGTTDR